MQAANVKPVAKPELVNEVYSQSISQKTDNPNVQPSNVVDLQKQANCKRLFEAYNDCV